MDKDEAASLCGSLETLDPYIIDLETMHDAWDLESRYGFSFWDSLIAASALASECSILYTEDFQHGMTVGNLTVLDPFA